MHKREPVTPDSEMTDRQHGHLAALIGEGEYHTCPVCGRTFEPTQRRQRYCNIRCKHRARHVRSVG